MGKLSDENIAEILNRSKTGKVQQDSNISIDDINDFGNQASLLEMASGVVKYNKMLDERITFINESLTKAIPFTRENLYLICAYTGYGKSTIAANISYPLWKQGKKTLVITNEESCSDVLFRIGCLELGYNFNDYKKGFMPLDMQRNVLNLFKDIVKCVKVLDVSYKGGATTRIEGIKTALESVKDIDFSAAMIDYYQLVQYSTADPSRSRYEVLNDLRIWLGQYIKRANIPVVMFAQLHSIGKRTKDVDSRVKECSGVIEPATVILEAVPNKKKRATDFIIHKDRFGLGGNKIICGFEKGRYVNYTQEFQNKVMDGIIEDLHDNQDLLPIEEPNDDKT